MSGSAVVIGATGAIGAALEAALIDEGGHARVYGFARSRGGADHLDFTDEASIATAAARVAAGPAPTLILVATGLHETDDARREDIDADLMTRQFVVNSIGPALVAKHFLPLLATSGTPIFAVLSARDGSIGDNRLGGAYALRASKAALNMVVKTLAVEAARDKQRAVIVAVDPGAGSDAERSALQLLDLLEEIGVKDSGKFLSWDGSEITP
ncbi:SDR family oxidoreductase [Sphingomonas sp. C3-2]|uniref:SDR family oxidoreductase n=1 Tax=Sphingomonas sp. C3-2 TaxID=3062169 RepID=UPI00294B8ABB|nr:SDR family oxidoreductase [Sphingomonas sp. C3-2]WOK36959.1 SDR family oxidoreductase [Sphingomonas sp. C3-2]